MLSFYNLQFESGAPPNAGYFSNYYSFFKLLFSSFFIITKAENKRLSESEKSFIQYSIAGKNKHSPLIISKN